MDRMRVWLGIAILIRSSLAASAADLPFWPVHCCPLQLQEILFGTSLPRDAVLGGDVLGKKWGYAVDRSEEFMPMFMSEDFRERPVRASPNHHCTTEATKTTYEVLTNPHRCSIRWYTTRYEGEQFVNTSGVFLDEGRGFMPAFNGFYFAKLENTSFGSLPSVSVNGETFGCRNETFDVLTSSAAGVQILYVDCIHSIATMAQARLSNISVKEEDLEAIRDAPSVYFNRTFRNRSNDSKKQAVTFSVLRRNSVAAFLSDAFASRDCSSLRTSFSRLFETQLLADSMLTASWFMRLSNKLGINVHPAFHLTHSRIRQNCDRSRDAASSLQDSDLSPHTETQRYRFSDDIVMPANSLTTTTASTVSFTGRVRFTFVYELFPHTPDTNNLLMTSLAYYGVTDEVQATGRGTTVAHFNGHLLVDSALGVTITITSSSLDGHSKDVISSTTQSLFPAPDAPPASAPASESRDPRILAPGLTTMTCLVN